MIWMIRFADYFRPGLYPATLDERPAVLEDDAGGALRPAPWVLTTKDDARKRITDTDPAWAAYTAALPVEIVKPDALIVASPDGTRWRIVVSNLGVVSGVRA